MQNLSLKMTHATSPEKSVDTANKGNASVDKAAATEKNSPFQMMLSKQVQAKQAPAKQTPAKQTPAKQTPAKQTPAKQVQDKQVQSKQVQDKPSNAEHVAADQKSKVKGSNIQHANTVASHKNGDEKKAGDINVVADAIDNPDKLSIEQVKLDTKTLLVKKEDDDSKFENVAISATDSNANFLAATMLAPVMNTIPLVNTQAASALPDANLASQMTTTLEGATQKQRNLDTALSNALSQVKNVNVPEKETIGSQATVDGVTTADKTRQLDVMPLSSTKQAVGDESINAKLTLNAVKDGIGKDAAIKELVMPAGFQSVAQVNNTLPAQQAGSTNNIYAYPGKTGWDQAISQKVMWMVGAGVQSATLTLNPPDLGPLQVVIHVHNDQADTTFISDNAEVRQALQDGLSNLRDKMSESGVQLGQTNVSSGQQSQQQFQQAMQSRQTSQVNTANATSPLEKTAGTSTSVRVSNGLVDTFA